MSRKKLEFAGVYFSFLFSLIRGPSNFTTKVYPSYNNKLQLLKVKYQVQTYPRGYVCLVYCSCISYLHCECLHHPLTICTKILRKQNLKSSIVKILKIKFYVNSSLCDYMLIVWYQHTKHGSCSARSLALNMDIFTIISEIYCKQFRL